MPPTEMLTLDICKYDKSSPNAGVGESEMNTNIPLLRKLGMFDLFLEREWVQGEAQEGNSWEKKP